MEKKIITFLNGFRYAQNNSDGAFLGVHKMRSNELWPISKVKSKGMEL